MEDGEMVWNSWNFIFFFIIF